jgi:hypothetical protein
LQAEELVRLAGIAQIRSSWKSSGVFIAIGLFAIAACAQLCARADNPPLGDSIGVIEGEAIAVEGPMSVEVVRGQVKTVLRSGSDVRVKSGNARIELIEGGYVEICGPAHFSVLKSGGSLTIALDTGTVHTHVENAPLLTFYTPLIQARPVSIGNGPEDTLVGLDASGAMCVRANKGAVRIEQQLTGQSVLVPQNGDVSLAGGQLENLQTAAGHCVCEPGPAKPLPPPEVSVLASTEELKKRAAERKAAPPETPPAAAADPPQEPVYQVFMPPLHYDAKAKVQTEYDPSLIILVRRVRVRPTLIFQGKVEGEAVAAQKPPPAVPPPVAPTPKPAEDTTWNRVRTFFHKLWQPSS